MENKPSITILVTVIYLLVVIVFGTIGLWFIAVAGLMALFIFIIVSRILGACAPSFYVYKFSPLCKKILGSSPPELKEKPTEESKMGVRGLLMLTAAIILLALLIYTGINEAIKLSVLLRSGKG